MQATEDQQSGKEIGGCGGNRANAEADPRSGARGFEAEQNSSPDGAYPVRRAIFSESYVRQLQVAPSGVRLLWVSFDQHPAHAAPQAVQFGIPFLAIFCLHSRTP